MRNNSPCPKCGGTDILHIVGDKTTHGNTILTGLTVLSAVPVHRFVCCGCGYSEEWIEKKDIPALKEKFGYLQYKME